MFELLKELTALNGVSGDEGEVREFIVNRIKPFCESIEIDPLGNIIAFKKGKTAPAKKTALFAHMDEVGFIITSINDDGSMSFSAVGGIDPAVAAGRRVYVSKKRLPGVIGIRAVHNLSDGEKDKALDFKSLYIDIGAADKKEAESLVSLGDSAAFEPGLTVFGDGYMRAKAIDDRFGCAVLIKLLEGELPYDCYFAFTVQEEIGARGAKAAAFSIEPDMALIIEATTAADIPGVTEAELCCSAGGGPVVPFMDKMTVYDKEFYRISKETAGEHNIPWQTKTVIAGGNDGGAVHVSKGGIRTLSVSVPCRYIHSPSCVAKLSDIDYSLELTRLLVERLQTV